ncbi:MAG: hypothetical protein AAB425_08990, partial [Bdellovibrionota bacterium]
RPGTWVRFCLAPELRYWLGDGDWGASVRVGYGLAVSHAENDPSRAFYRDLHEFRLSGTYSWGTGRWNAGLDLLFNPDTEFPSAHTFGFGANLSWMFPGG